MDDAALFHQTKDAIRAEAIKRGKRITELEAQLKKATSANLRGISFENGGMNMEVEGGAAKILAASFADQFIDSGGENYVELSFNDDRIGQLVVTLQKVDGLTPAGKVAAVEAQLKSAKRKGILEAVRLTRTSYTEGGSEWLCPVNDLINYAQSLEGKE